MITIIVLWGVVILLTALTITLSGQENILALGIVVFPLIGWAITNDQVTPQPEYGDNFETTRNVSTVRWDDIPKGMYKKLDKFYLNLPSGKAKVVRKLDDFVTVKVVVSPRGEKKLATVQTAKNETGSWWVWDPSKEGYREGHLEPEK